ncbi:MAG: TonB-dependent receptor, partial [Bacteroidota bacterium]|nr:TonB-dependent receptor [Bacteroidota bacterium]
SVARGYNAGGFNTSFTNEENRSFKPESSWNYEAGVKSKWFNNRLYTNFCVFYIDWKNQQITQTAPGGIGSITTNAGKSRNEGIELEIKYLPVEHLTTWFTAGYNDTKFVDNVKDSKTDYSNNVLPYAPKYTINTGVNYVYVLNNKCLDEIRFNTSYQGFGKIYWNEANSAWQNYYGLLNGRITAVKGNVEFGVWGKNLLNANYNSYYFQALGRSYVQIGKPVTLGVNLIYKF